MSSATNENIRINKRKLSEDTDRDFKEVKRRVLQDITNQQAHDKNSELEESMTSINQIAFQMPVYENNPSTETNTRKEDIFCLDDLSVISNDNNKTDEVVLMDKECERIHIYNALVEECSPEYKPYLKCVYFCDILEAKFEKENEIYNDINCREYKLDENKRSKIVKWMLEICYKLKLRSTSIYLSINIMDNYFFIKSLSPVNGANEFIGIAAASILLASKFEEESNKYINSRIYDYLYNLLYMNNNNNNLCKLEEKVLTTLHFDIYHPSSSDFLYSFFIVNQCKRDEISLAQYLCELTLTDYNLLKYKSSLISSSSLLLSLYIIKIHNNNKRKMNINDLWNEKLLTMTHYSVSSMKDCIIMINSLHSISFNNNNNIVYQKYNNKNYGYVSKIFEPVDIDLLLDSFIII